MVADQVERKHELDQKWISRSEGLLSCCFRLTPHQRPSAKSAVKFALKQGLSG